mmetsp:Transcript_11266/g.16560  ORF Transcript_11266/g.16560 Transcript_11266/m.16560 type:complete len:275 (+) Transcript_11266:132-956(+)
MQFKSYPLSYCIFLYLFSVSLGLRLSTIEKFALNNRLTSIKVETRHKFLGSINDKQSSHVILIFPGAGGPDQFTEELENKIISSSNQGVTTVKTLDWREFKGSLFTASYDGEAFGESISSLLWNGDDDLKIVHCIGVSVGAFAANACVTELHRLRQKDTGNKPYLRLTLLDPFTTRGVFGAGYGNENFGSCVDYAEQYLNTDDPVPTTNHPLQLCTCFDVTSARERSTFELPVDETMHCWPLVYFARYGLGKSTGKVLIHGEDGNPLRGSVTKL